MSASAWPPLQVQGNLKAACMRDAMASCVAVCLEGGPVSRVEARNMVCPPPAVYTAHPAPAPALRSAEGLYLQLNIADIEQIEQYF